MLADITARFNEYLAFLEPWVSKPVAVFLAVVGVVWWKRQVFLEIPGMPALLSWAKRVLVRIPRASPDKFSVMVLTLENDAEEIQRRHIVDAIQTRFGGAVEVLTPRTPPLRKGSDNFSKSVERSRRAAQKVQSRSRCDVLIWGDVLDGKDGAPTRLRWTVRRPEWMPKSDEKYTRVDGELPELFWADLLDAIAVVMLDKSDLASAPPDTVKLEECLQRIQKLTTDARMATDSRAAPLRYLLGNAMVNLGMQRGDASAVEVGLETIEKSKTEYPCDTDLVNWAIVECRAGVARFELGTLRGQAALQEEGIAQVRGSISERVRQLSPQTWAWTHSQLGDTLSKHASNTRNAALFSEAKRSFELEAEIWSKLPRSIRELSEARTGIASTLNNLGKLSGSQEQLRASEELFGEVIKELRRSREHVALSRAENNFGLLQIERGIRDADSGRFYSAAVIFKRLIRSRSSKRSPVLWSNAQNNLGIALKNIGQFESDIRRLNEGIEAYEAALTVRTKDRFPGAWADTTCNLAEALKRSFALTSDVRLLQRAMSLYRDVLTFTGKRPSVVTHATLGLSDTLRAIYRATADGAALQQSIDVVLTIKGLLFRDRDFESWLQLQIGLGESYLECGRLHGSDQHLMLASSHLDEAVNALDSSAALGDWCRASSLYAEARADLGVISSDHAALEEAVDVLERVLATPGSAAIPFLHDHVATILSEVRAAQVSVNSTTSNARTTH